MSGAQFHPALVPASLRQRPDFVFLAGERVLGSPMPLPALEQAWSNGVDGADSVGLLITPGEAIAIEIRVGLERAGVRLVPRPSAEPTGNGRDDEVAGASFEADDDDEPPNPHPERPQMRMPERTEQSWDDDDSAAADSIPAPSDPDAEPAQFLRLWTDITDAPHVTLVAILPDTQVVHARTFPRGAEAQACAWIADHQRTGRNVYFQPNETRPDCRRKPGKNDMVAALCRFADVDPDDAHVPLAEERDRLARLAAALAASECPPTVIIDSGSGLQPIWAVAREILTPAVIARVEEETAALERSLGAGGTHNIDRLLRLPGTLNYPSKAKLKKGRSVTRARLIFVGSNLYQLDQVGSLVNGHLVEAGLVRPRRPTGSSAGHTADRAEVLALIAALEQAQETQTIARLEDLADDLQARLTAAMMLDPETMTDADYARRKRLADRWAGLVDDLTEAGRDDTRSAADLSLAAMLKGAGFDHLEAGLILLAFPHGKANNDEWPDVAMRLRHVARSALRSHTPASGTGDAADPDDPRPQIQITPNSFVANAVAGECALLAAGTQIYRRLNTLARPIDMELDAAPLTTPAGTISRKTHAPGLIPITPPILRQMLHQVAKWMKYDARSKKLLHVAPSKDATELILHRVGFWPFPDVTGIIGAPVMRNDGSILDQPGYDPATGLILHNPPPMPDFNHAPTKADAESSCRRLRDQLLSGFPFVSDASRSVALSGIITPNVRAAIRQTPLHTASSPLPGTGKSYLWDLASYIANGAPMPVMAAGRDEAETEKRIVMMLLKALSMWSIDNVNGVLECDFLCQVITQPRIMPRKLGVSDGPDPDMLNTVTPYATGNNMQLQTDLRRRALNAGMDANMERPELRSFATQPHKLILADRGRFIADCLTIPLAYLLAGSPSKLPTLASFEEWSDVVRSALVWVGCADPVETVGTTDNPKREIIGDLLAAWPREMTAYTTRELLEVAQQIDPDNRDFVHPDLLAALQPIAKNRRGSLDQLTLGQWLSRNKDTVIGTLKLVRTGTDSRPAWKVISIVK
jgi:putative DNA primase/helicase